jgi:hypothetical protein
VPWTFSRDGCLRSGDQIMIKSKMTSGNLAVDLGSE